MRRCITPTLSVPARLVVAGRVRRMSAGTSSRWPSLATASTAKGVGWTMGTFSPTRASMEVRRCHAAAAMPLSQPCDNESKHSRDQQTGDVGGTSARGGRGWGIQCLLSILTDSLARSSTKYLRVNSRCLLYKDIEFYKRSSSFISSARPGLLISTTCKRSRSNLPTRSWVRSDADLAVVAACSRHFSSTLPTRNMRTSFHHDGFDTHDGPGISIV